MVGIETPEIGAALIDKAVRWLQELLRIDTCNPPGNECALTEYLQSVIGGMGIECAVLELEAGRTNLVVGSVDSRFADSGLLLSSHADTVPILNKGAWTQGPHSGVIADGCIWGRGAVDMKFKISFDLAMMEWAKQNGLSDRLAMLVVAGEETGGQFGSQFLCSRHRRSFNGKYVVNEIGGFPLHIAGKQLLLLQSGEKGHAIFEVAFAGDSMHASTPLERLRTGTVFREIEHFCDRVESYQLSQSAEKFSIALEQVLPDTMAPLATALKSADTVEAALLTIADADPLVAAQIRAMFFNTCTPTVTTIGKVANVLTASGSVVFDVRILPGTDVEQYTRLLKQEADALGADLGVSVEARVLRVTPGYEIDIEDALFSHCSAVLSGEWSEFCGGAPVAPFLLPASSDSSHYAQAGFTPLGFSPLLFKEGFPGFALAHAVDERVPEEAFREGLKLYIKALGSFLMRLETA